MTLEPPQNAGDKAHNDYLKDSKRNKYCSGQRAVSDEYRTGYGNTKWKKYEKFQ